MQFVHFILALAPIIWLIVALSVLKMPGYKACLITVAITAAFQAFVSGHSSAGRRTECALAHLSCYCRRSFYLQSQS